LIRKLCGCAAVEEPDGHGERIVWRNPGTSSDCAAGGPSGTQDRLILRGLMHELKDRTLHAVD
jgi:hypothetical protein